jgi:subtilisin family serine protease
VIGVGKFQFGARSLAAAIVLLSATAAVDSARGAGCVPGSTSDPWYQGCTNEANWNYSIAQIKAQAAWNRGYTGLGTVTAVFDSGIDTTDNQFIGRIAGPGFDATTNGGPVTTDDMWHGTFVSGIIAADRDAIGMVGVAYETQLLPVRIVNPDGSITLSDSQLAAGINYATGAIKNIYGTTGPKAFVFNNSWNSSTPITQLSTQFLQGYMPLTLQAYQAAVNAGAIVVFAAGNDSKSQPGFYAALPADFPSLQPGWVAAVATDSTGRIASYSDRCGSAAAWCLAAPGSNIISVYQGGYGTASGTSFAAPQISGAADVLIQEFPYLTNAQILNILFQSATKTGIYSKKLIYGQGLLNLDAATKPIGTLSVPTGSTISGSSGGITNTGVITGSAFGGSFSNALSGQQMLVLDSFSRGYTVNMSNVVHSGADTFFNAVRTLDSFGGRDLDVVQDGPNTLSYAFAVQQQSGGAEARAIPGKFYLTSQLDSRQSLNLGYNMSPALAFGVYGQGTIGHADLLMTDAVAIPYLDFSDKAYSVAYSSEIAGLGTLKLGGFAGQAKSSPYEDSSYFDPTRDPNMSGVYGTVVELDVPVGDRVKLGFDGGMVMEQGTLLGSVADGALAFGANTPTYFAGLTGTAKLGAGYSIFGGMHFGITTPSGNANTLIQSATSIATESFSLGVAKDQVFGKQDQAGFVFSQPLRAVSGSANLSVPVARDYFGNISYTSATASLAADGRELDLQAFYKTPLADGASLNLGAMLRLQPDNVRSAPPAGVAMAQFRMKF